MSKSLRQKKKENSHIVKMGERSTSSGSSGSGSSEGSGSSGASGSQSGNQRFVTSGSSGTIPDNKTLVCTPKEEIFVQRNKYKYSNNS